MTTATRRASIDEGLLAMFAWQGFMEVAAWTEDESDTHGGQIGAASDLRQVVGALHRVLGEYLASEPQTDFPGVLDYEVSEPLGAWYRRNHHLGLGAAQAEARRLVEQFFNPQRHAPSSTVGWAPA
jgi:hypothetical protein